MDTLNKLYWYAQLSFFESDYQITGRSHLIMYRGDLCLRTFRDKYGKKNES